MTSSSKQPLKLSSSIVRMKLGLKENINLIVSSIFYKLIKINNFKESSAPLILDLARSFYGENSFNFNSDGTFRFCVEEVALVLGTENTRTDYASLDNAKSLDSLPEYLNYLKIESDEKEGEKKEVRTDEK
ncbi:hypothetical protein M5689_000578 [Euphorbia peplus]|nr:hypothetical protein M5689_000578 [Euphorbia peplus]